MSLIEPGGGNVRYSVSDDLKPVSQLNLPVVRTLGLITRILFLSHVERFANTWFISPKYLLKKGHYIPIIPLIHDRPPSYYSRLSHQNIYTSFAVFGEKSCHNNRPSHPRCFGGSKAGTIATARCEEACQPCRCHVAKPIKPEH